MPKKLTWKGLIKAYVVFCMCMEANVVSRVFGGITPSADGRSGFVNNPIMFCFTASLVLGTLVLVLPGYKRCFAVLLNNPWITALYIWGVASIFWSPTPGMVMRGGLILWVLLLCCIISSLHLDAADAANLICDVVFVFALLSIFFQLVSPVRETTAPGWTGVYGEKNHLGIGMGVGCIAHFASTRRWTLWRVLQLALPATMLALSQSTTSMIFVLAAGSVYTIAKLPNRMKPLAVTAALGSVILSFAMIPHLTEKLFDATGKNTNFTGRDVIWSLTLGQWQHKPLLGYGLYSFWEAEDTLIRQWLGWNPQQAHNGFLEVGVTLGLVGEVLLLGTLFSGMLLILRTRRAGLDTAAFWLTLSWVALVIDSITEADFMIPGPLWFTYCLVYFVAYAELHKVRVSSRATRGSQSTMGYASRIPAAQSGLLSAG